MTHIAAFAKRFEVALFSLALRHSRCSDSFCRLIQRSGVKNAQHPPNE